MCLIVDMYDGNVMDAVQFGRKQSKNKPIVKKEH